MKEFFEVEFKETLSGEAFRNITSNHALGDANDYDIADGLRFRDDDRVVLLFAGQNLEGSVGEFALGFDRIEATLLGGGGQVRGVGRQGRLW